MAANLVPELRTWLLAQGAFPFETATCFEYQMPETSADAICAIRVNNANVDMPLKRPSIEIEVRDKDGMTAAITKLDTIYSLVAETEMMLNGYKTICDVQSVPLPMGYDEKNFAHASLFLTLITVM